MNEWLWLLQRARCEFCNEQALDFDLSLTLEGMCNNLIMLYCGPVS